MTTWLKIFDASGSWPTDPAACWADGYRVIAGYAGSQSWKTFTPAMLAKWVTPAHPFGIAAMYESSGDEAFGPDSYNVGAQHARAARAAWRALGMDDRAAIAYAVDKNATMAQIRGPIARYFQAIKDGEPALPISYLENDGSEWLAIHGITAGGFLPAAYSWGDPPVLATPANAPPHAIWLQEHNGVALHGGDVDTGHIRDDAPIWWATPHVAAEGDDMQLTDKITLVKKPDVAYSSPTTDVGHILASTNYYVLQTRNMVGQVIALLGDSKQLEQTIAAAVSALPAGVTVDEATMQAAFIGALRELAQPQAT